MASGGICFYFFSFISSLVILSFLFCHSLSEGKEKLCGSPPNSRMTLLQPSFLPLFDLQMRTLPKSQIPDSCFSLPIRSPRDLRIFTQVPHSHFSNTFSITPALNYNSTYLLEMITQIFQHNFEHVKNKQKTHSFSIQTGFPFDCLNVTSFGGFPKEIILER